MAARGACAAGRSGPAMLGTEAQTMRDVTHSARIAELGLIDPGTNGGWVQIMGPVARIAAYKAIETSPATDPCLGSPYFGLEQNRWPPTLIADTPANALARLFMLPGAVYRDPQFSWKFEVAPAGIGFVKGQALGRTYGGDRFLGDARTFL